MVVYIDLIFVVNLIFDGTLLLSVDLLLKRDAKKKKILLGALIGELSIVTLFVHLNGFMNFLFKIILSILMSIGTFSYKDLKYTSLNVIYLYLVGMILGGFEYYLYNEFQIGSSYGFKYLVILLLSPIALYIYYHLSKKLKNDYNNRYSIRIIYAGNTFDGVGYLDSGNKLVSPLNGKIIILVEKEYILYHKLKLFPVPYNALNHHGLIYCFSPDEVYVNGKKHSNLLIGLSDKKFNIDGCNTLLNARMEDL